MLSAEKQRWLLLSQPLPGGSSGMRRKGPGGSVHCILPYLFYYYVQRVFYTKKLNAVLINSMCRWIGAVPKVTILYRVSTNLFYFFETSMRWSILVSTMKLYSSTLGRLFKQLSNFHDIYFISFFCQKMSYVCLKSEMLCSIWCFCPNQSSLPWKSFPIRQNTTLQVWEDGWQVLQFSL